MDYITNLIERGKDDANGRLLGESIAAHLTYLSYNGIDDFKLVPIVNDGQTVSVIVAARGIRPFARLASKAFVEVTGLDSAKDIGELLSVAPYFVQNEIERSRQADVGPGSQFQSAGDASVNYHAQLLERENGDDNGRELCDLVSMYLTYLSDKSCDGFILLPVQNRGQTASIIVIAKGERKALSVPDTNVPDTS